MVKIAVKKDPKRIFKPEYFTKRITFDPDEPAKGGIWWPKARMVMKDYYPYWVYPVGAEVEFTSKEIEVYGPIPWVELGIFHYFMPLHRASRGNYRNQTIHPAFEERTVRRPTLPRALTAVFFVFKGFEEYREVELFIRFTGWTSIPVTGTMEKSEEASKFLQEGKGILENFEDLEEFMEKIREKRIMQTPKGPLDLPCLTKDIGPFEVVTSAES